jgi:hypothetical protein
MTKQSEIPIPFTAKQLRSYAQQFRDLGLHEIPAMKGSMKVMAGATGDDHALKKAALTWKVRIALFRPCRQSLVSKQPPAVASQGHKKSVLRNGVLVYGLRSVRRTS